MTSNSFPRLHEFLLKCEPSSDFNSQVKVVFHKEDDRLALSISEEIDNLSESLGRINKAHRFLEKLDPDTLNYSIDKKFLLRYRALSDFIKTITDFHFESLCAYYLRLLGCEEVRVTRRSSDQGLDFYGVHPFNKSSFFESVSERCFLIGQAKLYKSKVGTGEIREFVGSIELLRKQLYSSDTYSYKFATEIKPYTLINPIFISSSSFSRDAKELCHKIGIRMIDVVQLYTLLTAADDLFDIHDRVEQATLRQAISNIEMAERN